MGPVRSRIAWALIVVATVDRIAAGWVRGMYGGMVIGGHGRRRLVRRHGGHVTPRKSEVSQGRAWQRAMRSASLIMLTVPKETSCQC